MNHFFEKNIFKILLIVDSLWMLMWWYFGDLQLGFILLLMPHIGFLVVVPLAIHFGTDKNLPPKSTNEPEREIK